MKQKKAVLNTILAQGMLPLFYCEDVEVCIEVARTLYKAGVRILEFTNRGKHALDNFKVLKKLQKKELTDLIIGIGTIKNISEAEAFIDAGADFIVAPIVSGEVAKVAHKHKLLWIPGCMTPTEVYAAQKHGADLVKLFPGNILGPAFINSIKELFPGIMFMPSGGVEIDADNINNWFHAGASCVALGGKLISREVLEERQYDKLFKNAEKAMELVKTAM